MMLPTKSSFTTSRWIMKDAWVASLDTRTLRRLQPHRPLRISLMSSFLKLKTPRLPSRIAAMHTMREIPFSKILSQIILKIASMISVSNSSNIFRWTSSLRKTGSDTRRSNSTEWSLLPMTFHWGDKLLLLMTFAKPIPCLLSHSSITHTVEWVPKSKPTTTTSMTIPLSHWTLRFSTISSVLTAPRDPLPNGSYPLSDTPTRKSEEHTWDSSLEMPGKWFVDISIFSKKRKNTNNFNLFKLWYWECKKD